MIRGQQAQRHRVFNRLQRTNPGIKLLFGQIGAKLANAAIPDGGLHVRIPEVMIIVVVKLTAEFILVPTSYPQVNRWSPEIGHCV
jgi:hypothetical protein